MMELKDSGQRREFETGAVRDVQDGKGRCDLLPLDVVGELITAPELAEIEQFKVDGNVVHLEDAIFSFIKNLKISVHEALLEVSKHFEDGAKKYGENNWMKGIPIHCYIDSAVRHHLKYFRGDTDEPHDRAFIWNLLCAIWTKRHKPELDDIEKLTSKENEPNENH